MVSFRKSSRLLFATCSRNFFFCSCFLSPDTLSNKTFAASPSTIFLCKDTTVDWNCNSDMPSSCITTLSASSSSMSKIEQDVCGGASHFWKNSEQRCTKLARLTGDPAVSGPNDVKGGTFLWLRELYLQVKFATTDLPDMLGSQQVCFKRVGNLSHTRRQLARSQHCDFIQQLLTPIICSLQSLDTGPVTACGHTWWRGQPRTFPTLSQPNSSARHVWKPLDHHGPKLLHLELV